MIDDSPVLMNDREEPIHLIGHVFEVRRCVVPDINGFLPVSSAELRDIGDGSSIQRPQRVFVERLDAFRKPDLDAIQQQVVLPQQILLLNSGKQLRRILLSNRHRPGRPEKLNLGKQPNMLGRMAHAIFCNRLGVQRIPKCEADALFAELIVRHQNVPRIFQKLQEFHVGRLYCHKLFTVRHLIL